jgi:mannose-6-phosphate isomerase
MIIPLGPTVVRKIWGGQNLEKLKALPTGGSELPVGETWEISVHPEGPSFVGDNTLSLMSHEELPYLVKLIDTGEELSVQVHPDDQYAKLHENSSGKSECWVILKADPGAGIYLGFKQSVTKESFAQGIKNKENMSEYLNFYEVSPGDFFYVPAKTIHAIGSGITLAEVQQSSGITYRAWDWNRVDANGVTRELHIDKTLAVANFAPAANAPEYFRMKKNLFDIPGKKELITHETFKLYMINLKAHESINMTTLNQKRLTSLMNLKGKLNLNGMSIDSYKAVLFRDEKNLEIMAVEDSSFLLIE